ncbi:hypothetical protein OG432_34560 [Streptomyces sp. NBC_00442]|uniref:hypothetical protein n=1 Tax=Streptomyces sp. NBC_00442 TaxID=2903651 RepID=UPI002E1F22B3
MTARFDGRGLACDLRKGHLGAWAGVEGREVAHDPDGLAVHGLCVARKDHDARDGRLGLGDPGRHLAPHAVPGDEHPGRIDVGLLPERTHGGDGVGDVLACHQHDPGHWPSPRGTVTVPATASDRVARLT